MSTDNTQDITLDDYTRPPRPEYDVHGHQCLNCLNDVSQRYARVFGDNDNHVHACPECMDAKTDAGDGAAAGLNPRDDTGHGHRGGRQ
jgi:hypothetical protein